MRTMTRRERIECQWLAGVAIVCLIVGLAAVAVDRAHDNGRCVTDHRAEEIRGLVSGGRGGKTP